jgi:ABC-2 type transport system permease protein
MKPYIFLLATSLAWMSCNNNTSLKDVKQGKLDRDEMAIVGKIAGRIAEVRVSEGDYVKKGDTLAVLDIPELIAKKAQAKGAVLSAEAQYNMTRKGATANQLQQLEAKKTALQEQFDFAQKSLDRLKSMLADSLVPQQQYDEVYAKYQGAKAQLIAVKAEIEDVKNGVRIEQQQMALRLLFFGAPLLYGVLLGYVYNKGKVTDLPIIVVDKDQSSMSGKILEMIGDNEILKIAALKTDEMGLDRLVIEKDAACVVIIPENFEKQLLTKQNPEITTIVNTANVLTANYASGALQVVLGTYKAGVQIETLRKQGTPENLLMSQYEPFKTTFIKKNNRSTNYMYFLWPGVLITVLQQVMLLGLALSFASEFESGSFSQLIQKSNNTFQLIMVKVLPYILMSLLVWLMYGVFVWWFKMPFFVNVITMSMASLAFVLAVAFIGILVSILIPSQLKATEILMVVATPSFMISGFTWPLSQMPVWIQYIAQVIPTTHFLPIFRIVVIEHGTADMIIPYIIKLLFIAMVCFVLSYIALFLKKKKYQAIVS